MPPIRPVDPYRAGLLLVAAGTLLWSTAGWFVRRLDLDMWTVLGWRALFGALSLGIYLLARHGRRTPQAFASLGLVGCFAVPVSALSMIGYIAALTLTDVSNVMTIYATVPFVAALLAYFWFGERPSRRAAAASLVSLGAVAAMALGSPAGSDALGNALAFAMTAGFAFLVVLARCRPEMPMGPVNFGGAALCALLAFAVTPPGWPSAEQLVLLALFGALNNALAYLLFLAGARYIPAAETGLIGVADVALAPLWVFLAFGEVPSRIAIVAGAVVIAATAWSLAGPRARHSASC